MELTTRLMSSAEYAEAIPLNYTVYSHVMSVNELINYMKNNHRIVNFPDLYLFLLSYDQYYLRISGGNLNEDAFRRYTLHIQDNYDNS